jgi:hypothetical protein
MRPGIQAAGYTAGDGMIEYLCPGCGAMPCAGTVSCQLCGKLTNCRPWALRQQCITCGMLRQAEEHRQMRERSGPLYELAVKRGRIASAAWQKAGRPRKVTRVWKPVRSADGSMVRDSGGSPVYEVGWYLASTMRSATPVEATSEQVAAWQAYQESRPSFEPRHDLADQRPDA